MAPHVGLTRVVALLAPALVLCSCAVVQLTAPFGPPPGERTYYVSPAGDDAARGMSPEQAWRTLDRASSAVLRPGDRVLLEGGARLPGRLLLDAADAGDPERPVRIGSYGAGRASIEAPDDAAVVVLDTGGVEITDLVLAGAPDAPRPGSAGIRLFSELAGDRKFEHVVVSRVEASGFGIGIEVGGGRGATGFRGVRVTDADLHDNIEAGFASYGPPFDAAAPTYAHEDIELRGVRAYRNVGDPAITERNSGSGILLGSVRGGTVAWSVAHDNGGAGGAGEGPVGIWTYDSTGVVIEHNLSYRNRTAVLADGGGFGLDQNTSDSTLQYNVSYDNHGPGYLVYTGEDNDAHRRNVVRFNISSGDARRWSVYGGITVLGRVSEAEIYHNTVVMAPQSADPSSALRLGPGIADVAVHNNLFVAQQAGPLVVAESGFTAPDVRVQGNMYAAGTPVFVWGADAYGDLAAWRSGDGQETRDGRPTGAQIEDPLLPGPVLELGATAAGAPDALAGFVPREGSPLRAAGLDLRGLVSEPAGVDARGTPVSPDAPDVGALQAQPG